ncbi:hypothetical protein GN316_15475 [Xylophilus sp. Kf1]|nr:hypothetical protein [Xylophilus sp. Kf1]
MRHAPIASRRVGTWALALSTAVASFLLALGLYIFNGTANIYTASEDLARNWLPSVQAISGVRAALGQARRAGGLVVISGDDCGSARCRSLQADRRDDLMRAEAGYAPLVTPGEEQRLFDTYRQQRAIFLDIQNQLVMQPGGDRQARLEGFITLSDEAFDRTTQTLNRLSGLNSEGGKKAQSVVRENYARTQFCLYALNIVLLALSAVLIGRLVMAATHPPA